MPNGCIVIAAECASGIEPVEVVNEAVWRLGVLSRLPHGVEVALVSGLDETTVNRTLLVRAESIQTAIAHRAGRIVVLPHATHVIAHE